MDPFALQHEARKHVGLLVFLAGCALVLITAATAFVGTFAIWAVHFCQTTSHARKEALDYLAFLLKYPEIAEGAVVVSASLVLGGFFWKLFEMQTGDALMRKVGACRIRRAQLSEGRAEDVDRLRLFNVCEEMSIASGVDMPSVWLLPKETGINAFVAGGKGSEPALCVTAGALRYLERDELQGVIAHEFSHILNGDMQLNLRLLALISGITMVSRTGKMMLKILAPGDDGRRSIFFPSGRGGRRGKGGGGVLMVILAYLCTAVALWIIGSAGVFFARLIQCAVSRKREFLADASAAQFTRNPDALANALRLTYLAEAQQGQTTFGAWHDDVAHMLFTEGTRNLFATHPEVKDRITRLSPGSGLSTDERLKARVARIRTESAQRAARVNEEFKAKATHFGAPAKTVQSPLGDVHKLVPLEVRRQLFDPSVAGAVLTALLRGQTPSLWTAGELKGLARRTLAIHCVTTICDTATPESRRKWAETVQAISEEDGVIDSFELMIGMAMARRLDPGSTARTVAPRQVLDAVANVIATVASFGDHPSEGYLAAEKKLSLFGSGGLPVMPAPCPDADTLAAELRKLAQLPPLAKRELMFGLKETVAQDGVVSDEEADYLVAVADAIGAYGWAKTS